MLGVSVYFKDLDFNYLEEASKQGVQFVFTSLHIPEDNEEEIHEKLPGLLERCEKLGLLIVPDISPQTFEKLKLQKGDFEGLKKLGIKALRLDFGFEDPKEIAKLQKEFILMLNASVITKKELLHFESAGVHLDQVILMHNFYPHKNTGLEEKDFVEKNKEFLAMGLRTQAFVCGDDLRRYPLYEGLPTLEKHRGMNPYVAAVELMKRYGITEIMIGDSKAKIETLHAIQDYMQEKVMTIKVCLEEGYESFLQTIVSVRPDHGKLVRLAMPRNQVAPKHTLDRPKGALTMDNQLYGRYSGEVSIVCEALEADARVNVIGYIHPEYLPLVDLIDSETKIKWVQ